MTREVVRLSRDAKVLITHFIGYRSSKRKKVVKIAYPHIKTSLDDMCESAKNEMKTKDSGELGSWQRAVTTSDGCWLIRGFHSQCSTFVVVNFLTGGILYYGHLCM